MRIGLNRTGWLVAVACLASWAAAPLRADALGDGDVPAVENTVKLEIQISGLGAKGAKLAIKPAHPGCQFKPVVKTIARGGGAEVLKLAPIAIAATSTAADRDCSFEITVSEPGREPRVYRRGLRLSPPPKGEETAPARSLKCYLPASAVARKDPGEGNPRR